MVSPPLERFGVGYEGLGSTTVDTASSPDNRQSAKVSHNEPDRRDSAGVKGVKGGKRRSERPFTFAKQSSNRSALARQCVLPFEV